MYQLLMWGAGPRVCGPVSDRRERVSTGDRRAARASGECVVRELLGER